MSFCAYSRSVRRASSRSATPKIKVEGHQAGPAVRDKGQRDANDGHQAHRHADVERKVHKQHSGHAVHVILRKQRALALCQTHQSQ